MTGIEPDEIIDSQDWINHQGGPPSLGQSVLGTMAGLGALAYGMSEKDGLVPQPGEMHRNFNKVCKVYLAVILSPFIVMLTWALVVVIIGAFGGDHNNVWHHLCDNFGPIPDGLCD